MPLLSTGWQELVGDQVGPQQALDTWPRQPGENGLLLWVLHFPMPHEKPLPDLDPSALQLCPVPRKQSSPQRISSHET